MHLSTPLSVAATLLVVGALSAPAHAASCVVIDTERDSLTPDELRAAQVLLEDALEDAGLAISPAPCSAPWTASHVRLGSSLSVILSDGRTKERMSVAAIEELPVAYERLIRAIQTGVSVEESADRNSVTASEQSQNRIQAESLAYLHLGAGMTDGGAGTAIGGGWRYSLDKFAIDVGLIHAIIPSDGNEGFLDIVSLSGLYYLDGEAKSSLYVGGGLGYGGSLGSSAPGLTVKGSAGYELLRNSTIRIFPQLDVTVPMSIATGNGGSLAAALTLNVAFQTNRGGWGGIL
ncbi:MAG: hypothetical protein ACI8S6_001346 [Myxococcota bacterium]|jgi:hypothetical protein